MDDNLMQKPIASNTIDVVAHEYLVHDGWVQSMHVRVAA